MALNIIERNFFRLLRAGSFGSQEQIEPMSAWKWHRLFEHARRLKLASLLYDGINACRNQFFMHLTDELLQEWEQVVQVAEERNKQAIGELEELMLTLGELQLRPMLMEPWTTASVYDNPTHHPTSRVCIYFPFNTQGKKADQWAKTNGIKVDDSHQHFLYYQWKSLSVEHRHRMLLLSNKLNNLTLQNIIEKERLEGGTTHIIIQKHRIETIAPTLSMLIVLLDIIKHSLTEGIILWKIVDLGILLRKQGDRVDYVKLQEWIESMHFVKMSQIIGQILIGHLGFSPDEIPFIHSNSGKEDIEDITADIVSTKPPKVTKFLRYCPGESLSSVMVSITRSLENIEE